MDLHLGTLMPLRKQETFALLLNPHVGSPEKVVSLAKKDVTYVELLPKFLKHINPRLRFDRNYESIRPYAAYCEEIIELVD
jgi:hypothetical protein